MKIAFALALILIPTAAFIALNGFYGVVVVTMFAGVGSIAAGIALLVGVISP